MTGAFASTASGTAAPHGGGGAEVGAAAVGEEAVGAVGEAEVGELELVGEAEVGGLELVGEAEGHWVHAQLPSGASVSLIASISAGTGRSADTTVTVNAAWMTWAACVMDVNTLYLPAAGKVTCAAS